MTKNDRQRGGGGSPLTRRVFLQGGTAVALTAAAYKRVYGANERIGVGLIGYGLVGQVHARHFMAQPDARIAAVCDVYQPRLEAGAAMVGGQVAAHRDFAWTWLWASFGPVVRITSP